MPFVPFVPGGSGRVKHLGLESLRLLSPEIRLMI